MSQHRVFRFNLGSTDLESLHIKIKADPNWLHHCVPVMALQRPTLRDGCVDTEDLIARLKACTYEYEGFDIPGTQILALWKFILDSNRGDILAVSQVKAPGLSSAVPFVLWAYKFIHNIPYNAWRDSPYIGALLGKGLNDFIQYKEYDLPCDSEQLRIVRNIALTEKKRKLRMPDTGYKMNRVSEALEGYEWFDELPRMMKYCVLQTWLYHPSIRSDRMITDWKDWDSTKPSVYGESLFEPPAAVSGPDPFAGIAYSFDSKPKDDDLPW